MISRPRRSFTRETVFTDRTDLQEAFHKLAEQQINGTEERRECQLIHFHGLGGIGKTTLLRKLMADSASLYEEHHPVLLWLDFENPGNRSATGALDCLYDQLHDQRPKWKFTNYSYAKYIYAIRTGQINSRVDQEAFLKKYPFVDSIASAAGKIPVIGAPIEVAKALLDVVQNMEMMIKEKQIRFSAFRDARLADTILDQLPSYFCDDIYENIRQEDTILLFVDTYEKFHLQSNNTYAVHDTSFREIWIKDLLRYLPNSVCAIAGRDMIKWGQNDPFWQDSMEIHRVGMLSEKDTIWYLEQSNVLGEQLRHALWELTKGDPFHLELCVKEYDQLCEAGQEKITIEDFGETTKELVGRIVNGLGGDKLRDLAYIMGALHCWTRGLLQACVQPHFAVITRDEFDQVRRGCKIDEEELTYNDGERGRKELLFTMHARQSAILRESLDPYIRENLLDAILQYCDTHGEQMAVCLSAAIHVVGQDLPCEKLTDYIWKIQRQSLADHRADRALIGLEKLLEIYSERDPDSDQTIETECKICSLERHLGKFDIALSKAEGALQHIVQVYGRESAAYIYILYEKAFILYEAEGSSDDIVQMLEEPYHLAQRILTPEDRQLLAEVESLYAKALYENQEFETAEEIVRLILDQVEQLPDVSRTDASKASLLAGNLYLRWGQKEKAQMYLEKAMRLVSGSDSEADQTIFMSAQISMEGVKQVDGDEQLQFFTRTVQKCRQVYGNKHFLTSCFQSNVAVSLIKLGKINEAEQKLEESYQAICASIGKTNFRTVWLRSNLLACKFLNKSMKLEEIISEQEEICRFFTEKQKNMQALPKAQFNLGLYYYAAKNWSKAYSMQKNVLRVCMGRGKGVDATMRRCLAAYLQACQKMKRPEAIGKVAKDLRLTREDLKELPQTPIESLLFLLMF